MIPAQKEDLPKSKAIATGALNYNAKRWDAAIAYQQKYDAARLRLRDPCSESCQLLFKQLDIDWKKGFNVRGFWQDRLKTDPTDAPDKFEEPPPGLDKNGNDMSKNLAYKKLNQIGEGEHGGPPPDMTAEQILRNTAGELSTQFGHPLATAAIHGVLQTQ